MKSSRTVFGIVAVMFVVMAMAPGRLFASGFMISSQDPKAVGMGLAVAASIDNPSAAMYNPSLLTGMPPGGDISVGDAMFMIERSFKDGATGIVSDSKTTTHHLPNLFARYTKGDWAFALGVYSPFGLSLEWPTYWTGRYSSTFAELKTCFINPSVAYKFNDYFSAALGVSYVESSVDFQSALNISPLPDGKTKLTADGQGVGFNAAVTLKLPKDFTAALTYRSPVNLHYHGEAQFYVPPMVKALLPDGHVTTNIDLPSWTTLAIAKKMGPLTVEVDAIHIGWSSINRYVVRFDDGRPQSTTWKNWHDIIAYAAGVNYRWSDSLETQLGYMYDPTPVPKRTLTPEVPGSNSQLVMGGLGYRKGPIRANIAYQVIFYQKEDSTRNMVGGPLGTYDTIIHTVLINFTYSM